MAVLRVANRGGVAPLLVIATVLVSVAGALAPTPAFSATSVPVVTTTAPAVAEVDAAAMGTAQAQAFALPTPRWVYLSGRVQTCSWSYTALSGTVCRTRSTLVSAKIRYFGIPPTPDVADLTAPMFLSVWNPRARAWQEGPYQLDKPTRTVWLDGSLVSARPPKIGRAGRVWMDRCTYWLYVASRGTHCQLGQTTRVKAKRTAGGGVAVRQPNGRYRRAPGYTWHSAGHGFYALNAAKLPHRVSHPRPALPALSPGAPRTGSATTFALFDNITDPGAPGSPNFGRYHTFCPTRPIVVHVDYAGAVAGGYSTATAAALVTAAMNEAASASGYRWVLGSRVPMAPLNTIFERYGVERGLRYPMPSLDNEMLIGFGTTKVAAYDNGMWESAAGVAGPDLQELGDAFHTPTFGGIVLLNADWLTAPTTSATNALDVALHEIGHGFGLDHVTDADQVMDPTTFEFTRFSAGDTAGLRWLRAHSTNC